jgi:hypothetical protein
VKRGLTKSFLAIVNSKHPKTFTSQLFILLDPICLSEMAYYCKDSKLLRAGDENHCEGSENVEQDKFLSW